MEGESGFSVIHVYIGKLSASFDESVPVYYTLG